MSVDLKHIQATLYDAGEELNIHGPHHQSAMDLLISELVPAMIEEIERRRTAETCDECMGGHIYKNCTKCDGDGIMYT